MNIQTALQRLTNREIESAIAISRRLADKTIGVAAYWQLCEALLSRELKTRADLEPAPTTGPAPTTSIDEMGDGILTIAVRQSPAYQFLDLSDPAKQFFATVTVALRGEYASRNPVEEGIV